MENDDYDYNFKTSYPDRYGILKANSRENRTYPTDAELVLWEHLRKKTLGYKFRRQHSIGDYIADFICVKRNLIIEIDGGYHSQEEQKIKDYLRTEDLEKMGFEVMRFSNDEIFRNLSEVLDKIFNRIATIPPISDNTI